VGKIEASASVLMFPEANHVKNSICPGVSKMAIFHGFGSDGSDLLARSLRT